MMHPFSLLDTSNGLLTKMRKKNTLEAFQSSETSGLLKARRLRMRQCNDTIEEFVIASGNDFPLVI